MTKQEHGNDRTADIRKRLFVYTLERNCVIVTLCAMSGKISKVLREMLPCREREPEVTIEMGRRDEADEHGLDARVYRNKPDTGHQRFDREEGVRANNLVCQLSALGLQYTRGYYETRKRGGGQYFSFVFSIEATELNADAKAALAEFERLMREFHFRNCTIWCNAKWAENEDEPVRRLDTITLAYGRGIDFPARQLTIPGEHVHTYLLVGEKTGNPPKLEQPQPDKGKKSGGKSRDGGPKPLGNIDGDALSKAAEAVGL